MVYLCGRGLGRAWVRASQPWLTCTHLCKRIFTRGKQVASAYQIFFDSWIEQNSKE